MVMDDVGSRARESGSSGRVITCLTVSDSRKCGVPRSHARSARRRRAFNVIDAVPSSCFVSHETGRDGTSGGRHVTVGGRRRQSQSIDTNLGRTITPGERDVTVAADG